jgi:hypothetical protein
MNFAPFIENILITLVTHSFGHFGGNTQRSLQLIERMFRNLGVITCRSLDDINEQIDVVVVTVD